MRCCICGKKINGYGNNPCGTLKLNNKPVRWKKTDRCCDKCNIEFVIPERVQRYFTIKRRSR